MVKPLDGSDEDVATLTVRVPRALVSVIDHERKARAVRVPRNTWILEAVVEKLDREKLNLQNGVRRGADDGTE
jgi:predicted neutral ceramidase superfamily lipid hydrolase